MVNVETKWDAACFTEGPTDKDGISIHWWDLPEHGPTFEGTVGTFTSGARQTSAHYVAEAGRAACLVSPSDVAWANGNWEANLTKISIECNPRQTDGDYQSIGELIAQIRAEQGKDLPLFPHRAFTPTECPGTYDLDRLDRIARSVNTGGVTPKPQPTPAPKPSVPSSAGKSIAQLADEVIAGAYGTGDARRLALGSNYDAVQAEVNRRFGAGQIEQRPQVNISALADQTIAGVYGNGDARRTALGANYQAVQDEINRRYANGPAKPAPAPAPAPKPAVPSISQLADQVLAGAFGNGDERVRRLGANYNAVQAEINRRLGATSYPKGPDINALADAVMRGEYGDGDDRVRRLGVNYNAVQAEINRRFGA